MKDSQTQEHCLDLSNVKTVKAAKVQGNLPIVIMLDGNRSKRTSKPHSCS